MKDFAEYSRLFIKRCFTGIFVVADLLGVLLILISTNQPKVPLFISLCVFGIVLVFSSFTVWLDMKKRVLSFQEKSTELRDRIPKYDVAIGVIESYTIKSLIKNSRAESSKIRLKKENQTSGKATAAYASALKTLAQVQLNTTHLLGGETLEEELERINQYVGELEEYEKTLVQLYKIPITFESTRSDSNVEIQITSRNVSEFIVDDHYATNKIPVTYAPSPLGHGYMPAFAPSFNTTATRLYLTSYGDEDGAYSKLSNINARRTYDILDEELYVLTKESKLHITVTFHSEKINDPQVLNIEVGLEDAAINEINNDNEL